jgi:rhodanese-related sulfurtransferase
MNQLTVQNFIAFVVHHWWMWLALAVVLGLIIIEEMKRKIGGVRLSPQSVVNLINHEGGVVIDLRDNAAFKTGHIVDAINVPKQELEKHFAKMENYKEKPIILVANLDTEATALIPKLSAQGFKKIYILANGFAAWKNASLPLVKAK